MTVQVSLRLKTIQAIKRKKYCERHLLRKTFLELKRGRGIATRYGKNVASFLNIRHRVVLISCDGTYYLGMVLSFS